MSALAIRPLSEATLADFLRFFDGPAFADNPDWAGCFCFFPYHDPSTGSWSERTADENRSAMIDAIRSGAARGFLAYDGDRVVGWCNAAPRAAYPTLRDLPGDATLQGATPCFVIDPGRRREGIAGLLLEAACTALAEAGVRSMGAAPNEKAGRDAHNARGPVRLYEHAGYEKLQTLPDGTVIMEKQLG